MVMVVSTTANNILLISRETCANEMTDWSPPTKRLMFGH